MGRLKLQHSLSIHLILTRWLTFHMIPSNLLIFLVSQSTWSSRLKFSSTITPQNLVAVTLTQQKQLWQLNAEKYLYLTVSYWFGQVYLNMSLQYTELTLQAGPLKLSKEMSSFLNYPERSEKLFSIVVPFLWFLPSQFHPTTGFSLVHLELCSAIHVNMLKRSICSCSKQDGANTASSQNNHWSCGCSQQITRKAIWNRKSC